MGVMNKNAKCEGKFTRQNTKNRRKVSAIDFVICTERLEKSLISMSIDEEGLMKIKGKNPTDHKTIKVNLKIDKIEKVKNIKKVNWRITAPKAKWDAYAKELYKLKEKITSIFTDRTLPVEVRYKKFLGYVTAAAMKTIGKTTYKEKRTEKFSTRVTEMRTKKKKLWKQMQKTRCNETIQNYLA